MYKTYCMYAVIFRYEIAFQVLRYSHATHQLQFNICLKCILFSELWFKVWKANRKSVDSKLWRISLNKIFLITKLSNKIIIQHLKDKILSFCFYFLNILQFFKIVILEAIYNC